MTDGILFVSNGYGEDAIAISIVREITEKSVFPVYALPLVGEGKSYESVDCTIVGPRTIMPSGGVIPGNPGNLLTDIKSGLIKLTLQQLRIIKQMSQNCRAVVSVGDIYPALLSAMRSKRPKVLVGTAKSDYFVAYNAFEKAVMKRWFKKVFVRDEPTAQSLIKSGVDALWPGNAMMDCLQPEDARFPVAQDHKVVAILPGSRSAAFLDMPVLLSAAELLCSRFSGKVSFLCGIAPSIDAQTLADAMPGWSFACGESFVWGRFDWLRKNEMEVLLVKGAFGDLLRQSHIVMGQAGTGNEQAVGLGKPVVAFDTFENGGKMGWYRKRQKGLLGDSISVTARSADAIAAEIAAILEDSSRYEQMARIGFERMGPPGGAAKMADYILDIIS